MHSKKISFSKSSSAFIKRIFRARNIIIISEHKVEHVPLSGVMQILLLVGTLGLFSGVSYITGSYVTARNTIRKEERKIASTAMEKVRIGEEIDSLRHDLTRLSQNGKELSVYSKFIIDSHTSSLTSGSATPDPQIFSDDGIGNTERIAYLEGRVKEIQDENEHLVMAVRERTDEKIADFEDIIAMTGLESDKLEQMVADGTAKPGTSPDELSGDVHASVLPQFPSETGRKSVTPHGADEGGPFIPYENPLNDTDRDLITNVDRMVLLHDIIEQLPLAEPIEDAQTTGPFGKRVDPMNGRWAIHPGLDMAGPTGSKIYCTSAGVVISAGHRPAYGNMVDIDHGFGIVTRYAHMSKIVVKEGEVVQKGQQVGVQGSTGRSTGPHLHYEVRINDHPVNPVKFLNAGEYVSEN